MNRNRDTAMDPYKVLDVDSNATKREIIQAAALALRQRRFSGKEVAVAQKLLLDSISKKVHEFIHFIDVKPILDQLDVTRPKEKRVFQLKYLAAFDDDE